MARFLLEEQPADLAHLPLALIDAGLDNELWRPGDNQLVRLPRRAVAAQLILNERRWLPAITPRLPPPVPVPVRVGSPNANFRWPGQSCRGWSAPAHEAPVRPDVAALSLGRFLRSLHAPAPPDAPRNAWRGVALIERETTFDERAFNLAHTIDVDATRRVWDVAVAAPAWPDAPVRLHGDLRRRLRRNRRAAPKESARMGRAVRVDAPGDRSRGQARRREIRAVHPHVGHRPFAGDDLTGPRSLDDGGATARPRRLAAGSRCSPSPSTWGGSTCSGEISSPPRSPATRGTDSTVCSVADVRLRCSEAGTALFGYELASDETVGRAVVVRQAAQRR